MGRGTEGAAARCGGGAAGGVVAAEMIRLSCLIKGATASTTSTGTGRDHAGTSENTASTTPTATWLGEWTEGSAVMDQRCADQRGGGPAAC